MTERTCGEVVELPARTEAPVGPGDRALITRMVLVMLLDLLMRLGLLAEREVSELLDATEGAIVGELESSLSTPAEAEVERRIAGSVRREIRSMKVLLRLNDNGS